MSRRIPYFIIETAVAKQWFLDCGIGHVRTPQAGPMSAQELIQEGPAGWAESLY